MIAELDVRGFTQLLNNLVDRFENDPMTGALEACTEPVSRGFFEIFLAAEDSSGNAWPAHSPVTTALYGPHPLEILSGALLESLRSEGSQGNVKIVSDRELSWGTSIDYAAIQNYGGHRGFAEIPQREFIYWTDSMKDGSVEKIWEYIDREILS
jgi:phage gpG-like protein